jgi:hypothetical protein
MKSTWKMIPIVTALLALFAEPAAFARRLEDFLRIADRHHIGTIFILFDDCWNDTFKLGPQPAPQPGAGLYRLQRD